MPRLTLEAEPGRAVVTVLDSGAGIEPALLPRVFEAYTQADGSRGGLGLGLAVVRGLIELHGGGVSAASAGPGRGAAFSFWLPLGQGGARTMAGSGG
jgi:two-component system CheB/CheR fusion protein